MPRTADAVVIGGGVMGASIAFHLARAGIRPLILERFKVASQSTGRSGALVRMHYTNVPEASMAIASFPTFRAWHDRVGTGDCSFTRTGFAVLVGPEQVERLGRNTQRLAGLGVATQVLTGDRMADALKGMRLDGVAAAAFEPESGYADPVATTQGFIAGAKDRGALLEEGCRVRAISVEHGRVEGVLTEGGPIASPLVFSAAGCFSEPLLKTAGVSVSVRPSRAQLAFFSRPSGLRQGHPTFIDTVLGMYGRPHGDGTTLVGVGEVEKKTADPENFEQLNDASYIEAAGRRAAARFEDFDPAGYIRGHAGLYDMSLDTRALIGPAPGVQGLYVAAGFSGTGFKKSPAVGACLAELITEGRSRTADIHPFRLTRFMENQPITGDEYELPGHFGHRL
jgi:sarcosine oxidase subunit beta